MDSPNYRITIQGLNETISALERFAPDLKRALDKDIKGVISEVIKDAKDFIPLNIHPSGWARQNKFANFVGPLQQGQSRGKFITYDAAKAQGGIRSISPTSKKQTTGFRNAYGVIQRDAAGAIFETAGRGSKASRARTRASRSTNPRASEQFIGVLQNTYRPALPTANHDGKDKGRALIRAVDDNKKTAQRAIFSAIQDAERKAQQRMDTQLKQREV